MASQYFIGTVNSNWGQIGNWSATTGGLTNGTIPQNGDDVYFDGNSPNCTVNVATNSLNSFNQTGYTNTLSASSTSDYIIVAPSSGTVTCLLAGNMGSNVVLGFEGSAGTVIDFTSGGLTPYAVEIVSGTASQQDTLTTTVFAVITTGIWNTNNNAINVVVQFHISGSPSPTINAGTSIITLSGAGGVFTNTSSALNWSGGTIVISDTSSSSKSFVSSFATAFNNLSITGGGTGAVNISVPPGSSFNTFTINAPKTVTFYKGQTVTVSSFIATGDATDIITINSSTAGTQATLSQASGIVSCDYLLMQDSNATGGATWYAGANSTQPNDNNTGWIFTAPPSHNYTFNPTDSISSSDAETERDTSRELTDTITDSDAIVERDVARGLSDTISDSDSMTWLIGFGLLFSDSLDESDSITERDVSKYPTDNISIVESQFILGVSIAFMGELISTLDAIIERDISRGLSDSISDTDLITKGITRNESDSISESDTFNKQWAAGRTFSDSISDTDGITKGTGLPFSDSISNSDALTKFVGILLSDSISSSDSIVEADTLFFSDVISSSDSLGTYRAPNTYFELSSTGPDVLDLYINGKLSARWNVGSQTLYNIGYANAFYTDKDISNATLVYSGTNLVSITYANGDTITLTYSGTNVVTKVAVIAGVTKTWTYNYSGTNLVGVTIS